VSYATNTDIMHALDSLRVDVKKLVESHNDHERRIAALEPIKPQVERLTEHVAEIGAKVTVILERSEGQERGVGEALRIGARELQTQLVATVRAELSGLREEVVGLRDELKARPCIQTGECER
jgi:hypothetical protein